MNTNGKQDFKGRQTWGQEAVKNSISPLSRDCFGDQKCLLTCWKLLLSHLNRDFFGD
jgi:hypothetical protein